MQTKEPINNKDVDLYLAAGDRNEIAKALVRINSVYNKLIFFTIGQIAISANQQDKEDIYQDFLLSVFEAASNDKYESNPEKLSAYLVKIAHRRAGDWLRKKYRRKKEELYDKDMLTRAVDDGIKGSDKIKDIWELAHDKEKRPFILRAIHKLIPKLPVRERLVAEIIFMFYEDSPTGNDIRDKIAEYHNEVLTTESVRSARNRLYAKLQEKLQSII